MGKGCLCSARGWQAKPGVTRQHLSGLEPWAGRESAKWQRALRAAEEVKAAAGRRSTSGATWGHSLESKEICTYGFPADLPLSPEKSFKTKRHQKCQLASCFWAPSCLLKDCHWRGSQSSSSCQSQWETSGSPWERDCSALSCPFQQAEAALGFC